jgi:uncharacterized protein YndB with AHSA1/START domain
MNHGSINTGRLINDGRRPAVRLERHLADAPAVVWDAITDREQLRAWFPCDVLVTGERWEAGAEITFRFPADVIDMTLTGVVLAVEEPKLLEFSWGDDILRFELDEYGRGTRLILVNELAAGTAARSAAGWEVCLDRLAGLEPTTDSWRPRFDAYVAQFEPALGAQDGPPDGYKAD